MAEPENLIRKALLLVIGSRWNPQDDSSAQGGWRPVYWLYAAIIPAALYSFEAIKISLYHVSRAPNVNFLTQLSLMFAFYGLWVFAPRLCWSLAEHANSSEQIGLEKTLLRLSALGLLLSCVHLFLLTILLLIMNARAAWAWEPIHILHAFGETWLSYAGLWLMGYAITTVVILYSIAGNQPRVTPPVRYEVRENGKTFSIPVADIYWVKAAGNYAELHTARGVMMVRKTLSQVNKEIGGRDFIKAHRSALINGHHVLAIKRQEEGGYVVQLSSGEEAPLSRRMLSEFKQILKSVG